MKKTKNNNRIANIFEGIFTLAIVVFAIVMMVITFTPSKHEPGTQKRILENRGGTITTPIYDEDIENWVILDVNEDYSEAKVLKSNGHVYYMSIYDADDYTISIVTNDGELHEFSYSR